ncbi:MAG: preprotein translocase subunit SecG [Terriglobia bacterium]
METLLTTIHVFVCIALILVVLLQSGRAADLAGAFGGAGSQTAFGPRGAATFLSKATTVLAISFMLTSLGLAVYSRRGTTGSVLEQTQPPVQEQTAPAQPAPQEPGESPPPTE